MHGPMPLQGFRNIFAILALWCGIGATAVLAEGRVSLPETPLDPIVFQNTTPFTADQDPADFFQIFVGELEQCCDRRTPIAGTYVAVKEGWSFSPQFDLIDGQPYVARTVSHSGVYLTEFELVHPDPARGLPIVTAIYPSGPEIPENTLRFYIHFSEPMKPHVASDFIKLVDASGNVDDAAFMQFKQELWSADRRRLTVLMDPGRIKRGVSQNLSLGPALEQGQSYRILVDAGWPAAGNALALQSYEHSFRVSAPLRSMPDTSDWRVISPRIGSRDTIQISFDRPFDRAQLQSEISVISQAGVRLGGKTDVSDGENFWAFTPDRAWEDKLITLVVSTSLEDVAGNNFRELLDHAVGAEERDVGHLRLEVTLSERLEATN